MALEQVRKCDHCKKSGASPYQVGVFLENAEGTARVAEKETKVDLCASCFERMSNFVERGINPPKRKPSEPGDAKE